MTNRWPSIFVVILTACVSLPAGCVLPEYEKVKQYTQGNQNNQNNQNRQDSQVRKDSKPKKMTCCDIITGCCKLITDKFSRNTCISQTKGLAGSSYCPNTCLGRLCNIASYHKICVKEAKQLGCAI